MGNKIKILIVDDSRFLRKIVSDFIGRTDDIDVIGAVSNGREALDFIYNQKPDLITLDVEMPVMDGLTFLEKLKQSGEKIPVIMLSVLTQQGAQATFRALDLGAYDFVPKPSPELDISVKEVQDQLIDRKSVV